MSPRRYFIAIVTASLGLVAAAWILALWLEPLYGDLTRIGGYAERHYGWNTPMEEFHPLLATWGETYDHPVDVLVIGDSFANLRPPQQWQNWLAARTGWRIHTLDVHKIHIDDLMATPSYRSHPPKVVIWNVVDLWLLDEIGMVYSRCGETYEKPRVLSQPINPISRAPITVSRSNALVDLNLGFSRIWLWRNFLRYSVGLNMTNAKDIELLRSDLFSSRCSDRLLFYSTQHLMGKWKAGDMEMIRCGFTDIASRFEANGKTRFLSAIAPAKSSAYSHWVSDTKVLPYRQLPELFGQYPVSDARLDLAMKRAIAVGTRDVYMPDDTHWGTAGQKLAADAILDLLIKEGLTQ